MIDIIIQELNGLGFENFAGSYESSRLTIPPTVRCPEIPAPENGNLNQGPKCLVNQLPDNDKSDYCQYLY